MGKYVDGFLETAGREPDGIGKDGGWRNSETVSRARCRVFAVAVPVDLKDVTEVRVVGHRADRPNGDDSKCGPLKLSMANGLWRLTGQRDEDNVGCDFDYVRLTSMRARQLRAGQSAIGLVFKNWRDTAVTLQFSVSYRKPKSKVSG
jgi:hypothetical protein